MAKACTYKYKGKEYSEEELDDLLLEARANKYGDIVFERDEKEKNITLNELDRVSRESAALQEAYKKAKEHPRYLDGEDELQFDFPERGKTWVFPHTGQNGKCTHTGQNGKCPKNEEGSACSHAVF